MTQINLQNLVFDSKFSGFGNYTNSPFSFVVASQTVSVSYSQSGILATTIPNSISQTEVQFTGLDSRFYIYKGHLENFYTSGNVFTNDVAVAVYEIDVDSSYPNAFSFQVTITIFNLSLNPTVTVPGFTVASNLSLYISPFGS